MEEKQSQDKLNELKPLYTSAKKILILLKKNPSFDGLAAGLALFLALQKAGKNTEIYCETPVILEQAGLVGINKIKNKIGNKNLIISFDYSDGAIEKISYNIEGDKFNLVISPREGFLPLDPKKINYSYSGVTADLIFTIEAKNLKDLGKINENEEKFLEKAVLINIHHLKDEGFAKYNVSVLGALSCSELVLSLFPLLNLEIDKDIASNLLAGIEYATVSFTDPRISAESFEAIAYLLRQGAKRQKVPSLEPEKDNRLEKPQEDIKRQTTSQEEKRAPIDWLQPKIYKGGQLI